MTSVKCKIATAVLVLGVLALGAGALATHVLAGPQQAMTQARPAAAAPEPKGRADGGAPPRREAGDEKETIVRGQVRDADGKPLAEAKLLLLGNGDAPVDLGTTAADGRFAVPVPKSAKHPYLVAHADGAGVDFVNVRRLKPADPVELRLGKDQAIRGRVVDTEGRPVRGVRVAVRSLNIYAGGSLDPFLAEWKKRHFMSGIPTGVKHLWWEGNSFLGTTTDADGRFVVAGTGAEWLVSLRLRGAGIADEEVWVANRRGFDPKPYNEATRNNIPKGFDSFGVRWLLHGPDLSVVAEAEKPIRGVVKEADTGKVRPGVEVWLTRNGDDLVPLMLKAKTDADGRYEVRGARKAKSYMVEVLGDAAAGYMACQARADDTPGYQPVAIDVRVKKGVVITGKVIDKTTGKPVPGFAMAGVLSDNPFAKDYPEFDSSAWIRTENKAEDGTFRIVTIPGPVLLMGGPEPNRLPGGYAETLKYKPPVPDPKYSHYFPKDRSAYYTLGGGITPLQGNYCKVLQIEKGTSLVEEDIVLEQASAVTVKVRDAEGRPLTGAYVTGISPRNWTHAMRIETDSCSAYHVDGTGARLMVFYEPQKKLLGTLRLKAGEQGPAVAKLGPGGVVKGRLVAEDGKPLAGYVVVVAYREREADMMHEYAHRAKLVVTDANGAFRIDELIPGVEFHLYHYRNQRTEQARKVAEKTFTARAGESLDLGDLKPKPAPGADGE